MAELRDIRPFDPDHYIISRSRENQNPSSETNDEDIHENPNIEDPILKPTRDEINYIKHQNYKNLLVICVAFLLNFTAFQNMQNIQSSLNRTEGLGVISLSIIYATNVLSSLFIPAIVINLFGCKWTMVLSLVPYFLYIAANFYPIWPTIIPASILLGVVAGTLWVSKCTYLVEMGMHYAKISGEDKNAVISSYFGIFFLFFQSAQIWGNLISTFILYKSENTTSFQITEISEEELNKCGALYCIEEDYDNNSNLSRPDIIKVYTLCGTYVGLGVLATLTVALLLGKLKRRNGVINGSFESIPQENRCECSLLAATIKQWGNKSQIFLIPITIYSGLEQAFIASDYSKSYVACSLGIWMIGLVMVAYGVSDTICSYFFGRLAKYTGRIFIFILGALVHCGTCLTLFFWHPHPDSLVMFFVVAALWGMGDAVWQTQLNALYGCIFPNSVEAGFANYRLWESLGFIVAFAYSNYLCVYVKIYILLGMLSLGMMGYLATEYVEKGKKKQ